MLLSVAMIISHNSIAHHHHNENMQPFVQHDLQHHHDNSTHDHEHNEESDSQHNIFSFAQLDEDYLPSQFGKISLDLPVLYLITPAITLKLDRLKECSKIYFAFREEISPPHHYSSNLFSRPPPGC
jgi:hypothetical protein